MTMRIALWLCVLMGVSGCGANLVDPTDVASDDLGLQNDEANEKEGTGSAKGQEAAASCDAPPKPGGDVKPGSDVKPGDDVKPDDGVKPGDDVTKPEEAAIEACYVKAKSCYTDTEDPASCDALLKSCSMLADQPPQPDECSLKVESCLKSANDSEDCGAIKLSCIKPPPLSKPETTSLVESCWRKYKECGADDNDPKLCESVGESCKTLESADLQ
jgi:hypothetical protein